MGPVFLRNEANELAIAAFRFNYWGYEDVTSAWSRQEDIVDELVAQQMRLPTVSTRLVGEGGNREFNGRGVLMMTEAVELQRNPTMTLPEIESALLAEFHVSKIIWLKEGLYEDDLTFRGTLPGPEGVGDAYTVITTGGHIDEFARFVDENTIILAEVSDAEAAADPIAAENKRRLDENYDILLDATDQDGQPFEILRIVMPPTMYETMSPGDGVYDYIAGLTYEDGSEFPVGEPVSVIEAASYANFLVTNGLVLGQSYATPERSADFQARDDQARATLEAAFPDREIVLINAEAVNLGGGGIHCITQQQPSTAP
jgi:agmatine deiminase